MKRMHVFARSGRPIYTERAGLNRRDGNLVTGRGQNPGLWRSCLPPYRLEHRWLSVFQVEVFGFYQDQRQANGTPEQNYLHTSCSENSSLAEKQLPINSLRSLRKVELMISILYRM